MNRCDALDGVRDGMISNPLACTFDPEELACKPGETGACIAPEKAAAIKKAFSGPRNMYGAQVYPGFLYDAGITMSGGVSGLLNLHSAGLFGPYTTATTIDVDKEALHASDPLVEPTSTNLTTFSSNGGKLIFFHGDSNPWFSALDTLGYYESWLRPTQVSTRLQDGAECFWFRVWRTAAAVPLLTTSICSAPS